MAEDPALNILCDLNVDDILRALGGRRFWRALPACRRIFHRPALVLARHLLAFDKRVARTGLPAAAAWLLGSFTGAGHLRAIVERPRPWLTGGRLFVANHPGLFDALGLAAAIGRDDLRILAIHRPFLRALPGLSGHLIAIPEADDPDRDTGLRAAIRQATDWMRAGHALLTFPAGVIEPDPAWTSRAAASIGRWSRSTGIFARLVEGLEVHPCVVAGVGHPAFVHHPLGFLRRREADRAWLRAVLQLGLQTIAAGRFAAPIVVAVGAALERPFDQASLQDRLAAMCGAALVDDRCARLQ